MEIDSLLTITGLMAPENGNDPNSRYFRIADHPDTIHFRTLGLYTGLINQGKPLPSAGLLMEVRQIE